MAVIGSAAATMAQAAPACRFPLQGDGHIAGMIDIRTLRMADGAEIRLSGIGPVASGPAIDTATAAAFIDHDVTLHGDSDAPDRYGRQRAFVFADPDAPSLQSHLLAQGAALMSGTVTDKACSAELAAAETAARRARRGLWAQTNVIKNAESPGDILADVGRFAVVEGRVVSVRQAGTMTYLNFGRRWTQDFAVTISRRMMTDYEAAGITVKAFERQRIRVRGWVEMRGGPRIEAVRIGQIEVVGDDRSTTRE